MQDKNTCCNQECNQGRDCPVRNGTYKPSEAVHQIQEPAPVQAAQTEGSVSNATLEVAPAAVAEQALLKVLHAIQRYMPPDGVSDRETLSEIIGIVDPWPLGDVPAAVAVPDAVRDALLQSEAALEVATARILKADPGHSISVTSEAKALVAVRAALAATPAATAQARGGELNQFLSAAKDAGITHLPMSFGEALRELEAATGTVVLPEPDFYVRPSIAAYELPWQVCNGSASAEPAYLAATVRALLATGGQAQAVWDGNLPESLQRALNELRIDCKTDAVSSLEFEVRSVFEGMHTSLTTVKRMYHAAQKRLDSTDAAQPDPFAAPQAQADARDAEQERWMEIGKAIERACIDLPDSTEIVISLERNAGTVTMFDPDGNEHDQFSHEDGFAGVVNAAIEAAVEAAKEQG